MPRLIIFDDKVRGVDLPRSPVIIGRSKKSDIPIYDDILSRKHCAIVPHGDQFRLVDLKSSNGTYLNGNRIDKTDLAYDDIVEIGNTVLVFMDTGAWNRGEGLARLRNPVKAQELIQRINAQKTEKKIPLKRVGRKKPASRRRKDLIESMPDFDESALKDGARLVLEDDMLDLLVDYSVHRTVELLIRNRPWLRRLIVECVESALVEMLAGDWEDLKPRLRDKLKRSLAASSQANRDGAGDRSKSRATGAPDDEATPPDAIPESSIDEPDRRTAEG